MQADINTPIEHTVVDAETNQTLKLEITADKHGLVVTLPHDEHIILDLSRGVLAVLHADDTGDVLQRMDVRLPAPASKEQA